LIGIVLRKLTIAVLGVAALGGFLQAQETADALAEAGTGFWRAGDFAKAEQTFRKLREVAPNDLRWLIGLTETLASENRIEEAVELMQAESDKNPGRRDLREALANLLVRDEMYEEAIAVLADLLKQEPTSAGLLFKLGEAYRRIGDLNAAMENFRRAMVADPTNALPGLQLALLLDGSGKRDLAVPVYEQVLKVAPDNPVALNNLAFALAEAGTDLDRALTMAQLAREKLPNSPDIADTLGWIYLQKNLGRDAISIFRPLVEQEPRNASFHYHFGLALLQTGDKEGAAREFNLALQNNPPKDDENKIKALLMGLAR
jgi:Flp pilus assembly protein TadD